ncbi:ferritin heavy chain A-like [Hemicordylus capensis]|uniref:ferritin heavy chain A-like n=1 Tax=Hemicordylus capensis TaxID=884348 RepID=UPI0023048241|nr:ferritin heavy chain A-like [Hemicordylus capensis]
MRGIVRASQVCQNVYAEYEVAVTQMVNLELHASYVYLSMSYQFDRDDVALKPMAKFLGEQFLQYQAKRRGHVVLQDIQWYIHSGKPEQDKWGSGLDALEKSLQLEKKVNLAQLDLHKLAKKGDPHLCDFLESEYLEEQVKAIKRLGDHLTNLRCLGLPQSSMGEYLFDKLTFGEKS